MDRGIAHGENGLPGLSLRRSYLTQVLVDKEIEHGENGLPGLSLRRSYLAQVLVDKEIEDGENCQDCLLVLVVVVVVVVVVSQRPYFGTFSFGHQCCFVS